MRVALEGVLMFNIFTARWNVALDEYRKTGRIEPLALLVEKEKIPDTHRTYIADILRGRFEAAPGNTEAVRSHDLRVFYEYLLHEKTANLPFVTLTSPLNFNSKKWAKDARQSIYQAVADRFYKGDKDTARRIIERKVKNHGWPSCDFKDTLGQSDSLLSRFNIFK